MIPSAQPTKSGALRLLLGVPGKPALWLHQPDGGPDGLHNAKALGRHLRRGNLIVRDGRISVITTKRIPMAYQSKDLSVLAYANGFTMWHFTTTDSATTVDTAGYFNAASTMFRLGDIIVTNVDTAGDLSASLLMVKTNATGIVTVVDISRMGAMDMMCKRRVEPAAAE